MAYAAASLVPPPPEPPSMQRVIPPPPPIPSQLPIAETPEATAERVVDDVLRQLSQQLSDVLERDLNRRLVEASVVGAVDDWWSHSLAEEEATAATLRQFSSDNAEALHSLQAQASQSIQSAVNAMFGGGGAGEEVGRLSGLPGFGLKASMPKIRFKKRQGGEEERRSKSLTPQQVSTPSSWGEKDEDISSTNSTTRPTTPSPPPPPSPAPQESQAEDWPPSERRERSQSGSRSRSPSSAPSTSSSSSSSSTSSRSLHNEKETDALETSSKPPTPFQASEEDDGSSAKEREETPLLLPPSPLPPSSQNYRDGECERDENEPPAKRPRPSLLHAAPKFQPRDQESEVELLDLVGLGVDVEDQMFLRKAFEALQKETETSEVLGGSHWYPHPPTPTIGHNKWSCARTSAFVRLGASEKAHRSIMRRVSAVVERTEQQSAADVAAAKAAAGRDKEIRAAQRRLQSALGGDVGDSELLRMNQLKLRKKLIRFGRSRIHGWGLFALEDIAPDEMIVEYVGEKIRSEICERREQGYIRRGIGSSYLFRVDSETVIDATKCGNMARFINHSCSPSCYAKIITVEGSKRIVIYSKKSIRAGEEITYDYKFPREDDKIPCLCRAQGCRGSLN